MRAQLGPAVVTGAARGIGAAIAARLAADGHRVGLIDVDPAVGRVAAGLDGEHRVADLADPTAATAAVHELVDGLGGCWALVNNAGLFHRAPLAETCWRDLDRLHAVNVRAPLVTTQAVTPAMTGAGGGRIVNIASMAAKRGTPGEAAYAATKAALVALTRIAAMELGPHGVTVNAVCPGYVLTDLGADTRTPEQVEAWTAMSPLGRLATPDDVADVVAHLVGPDGGYQTGQAVNVTGGMCTW